MGIPIQAILPESYQVLKGRIRIMTMPFPRKPRIRGAVFGGMGAVLVGLACCVPGPPDAQPQRVPSSEGPATPSADVGIRTSSGHFRLFIRHPEIKNRDAVMLALERAYPAVLRDAGVGGTVELHVRIDEEGRAQRTLVNRSSGQEVLDGIALQVAAGIEFHPALNRDRGRAVWVSLPIAFSAGDTPEPEISGVEAEEEAVGVGARAGGTREEIAPGERLTGEITGTVTEAGTGQPLHPVQVFIPGTPLGTVSNREGRFAIKDVPAGERRIVVVFIGYGRIIQPVTVEPDGQVELVFSLQESPIPIPALVVRGGGGRGTFRPSAR